MSEQTPEKAPETKAERKPVRTRKPTAKHTFWYGLLRVTMAVLSHTVAPLRYVGRENLPEKGPYIIISNHLSMMDPLVVAYSVKKDAVAFMGKKELARSKFMNYVFNELHMIIVDRHNSDMEAMRACMQALRAGEILGIFPEGTRHHEGTMEQLESGVGLIALRGNVPLVPFYLPGKYKFFRRNRVVIGKPIDFSDLRAQGINKDSCAALLERITATYKEITDQK